METPTRVSATPQALELIERLKAQHGELLFHQSGGCCDGSAPMCFPRGEFLVGDADVQLGEIGGVPFYMYGGGVPKVRSTCAPSRSCSAGPVPL